MNHTNHNPLSPERAAAHTCNSRARLANTHNKQQTTFLPLEGSNHISCFGVLEHGSHNVSRWMTWLPISLKNAAKCDKWYQLQNHSITESLNAKGAREKLFTSHPRACRILSVEHIHLTTCVRPPPPGGGQAWNCKGKKPIARVPPA